jgi:hypothetical protein
MAKIEIDPDDIVDGVIEVDIEDYLDEVDTYDLAYELMQRGDVPNKLKKKYPLFRDSKTPIRDAIIDLLDLQVAASPLDVVQAVKDNWYR